MMEKVCCELKCGDDFEMKCVETDEGFRIEVKGDKEKLKEHHQGCWCAPFSGMHVPYGKCGC